MDIHILWALVVAFAVIMYTLFDGFDLGVGVLLLFFPDGADRSRLVASIYPVWDANETWLVLAGVGLFGGFPAAYSLLLPALYIPIILMIICLALRGVSMEFRFTDDGRRNRWDLLMGLGSAGAAFCQGLVLGNLMEGISLRTAGSGAFSFVTPFTLVCGLFVPLIDAFLGAAWINFKTDGELQKKSKRVAKGIIVGGLLLAIAVIGLRSLTPIFTPSYGLFSRDTIFAWPTIAWYSMTGGFLFFIFRGLDRSRDGWPFALSLVLSALSVAFILSRFWPAIIPPAVNVYDAGAPIFGNTILLVAAIFVIPLILGYLLFSYLVFKGKVGQQPDFEPALTAAELRLVAGTIPVAASMEKRLPVLLKLVLALGWIGYFFLVVGYFGNPVALGAIVVFIFGFIYLWAKRGKARNKSGVTHE